MRMPTFCGGGCRGALGALLAGLVLLHGHAFGQDYAREKRWADEITPAIVVGDPLNLELPDGPGKGHRFLAIFTPGSSKTTAVVLAHGLGIHPDHSLVGALRIKLADLGYSTLSVQMPVAKSEGVTASDYYPALFPEAGARLSSAAQYLRGKGYTHVVLVAHSMGSWMANAYLIETPDPPFAAWVSLGVMGRYWGASLISIPWLGIEWLPGKLGLPTLDVYGENDFPSTLEAAAGRARALSHIPRSQQVMIPGADHYFAGREETVARAIEQFIRGLAL